jgi:hypothetical protein
MSSFGLRTLDPTMAAEPGAYLMIVRPAQDSPETWAMWSDPSRHVADARSVCDPTLAARLESLGIVRCTFREYLQNLE